MLFHILVLAYTKVSAQDIPLLQDDTKCYWKFDSLLNRGYYMDAEKMPEYRWGYDSMQGIIRKNLKWPGGGCCIQAKVIVALVIEPDGSISDKKIISSGFEDDMFCSPNDEALEAVEYLTDWVPGQCNGKKVAVLYLLPIRFEIER